MEPPQQRLTACSCNIVHCEAQTRPINPGCGQCYMTSK